MPSVSDQLKIEEIWDAYPKKCDHKRGRDALARALNRHPAHLILAGVQSMAAALTELGIARGHPSWRLVKYPQGYFNGDRFLEEPQDFPWYEEPKTRGTVANQGKYDGDV